MELPIAVHLLLSLGPVATVSPETCFPHGHHCSSWGRTKKLGGESEGEGCGFIRAYARISKRSLVSFKEPGSGWEAPSKTGTSYKDSLHLCLIWPCEVMFPLKGPTKQYFVPK